MVAEPPFWPTVPGQGRCRRGAGGASPKNTFTFEALARVAFRNFWPIWLSVLALLRKAFAA